MPMSLMTSLNSVVPVLLVFMSLVQTNLYLTTFSNKAIVAYNVVKIQIERKELFFFTHRTQQPQRQKYDVILLRAMFHSAQAFSTDKTTST